MNEATIAQLVATASLFLIFGGLFIWGWKTGQFKNIEEAKYNFFRRTGDRESKQDNPPKKDGRDGKNV